MNKLYLYRNMLNYTVLSQRGINWYTCLIIKIKMEVKKTLYKIAKYANKKIAVKKIR